MIYKKTKIICTIGPAVDTVEKIGMLIDAGMDAARLNFSHGSIDVHKQYIQNIRKAGNLKKKMIAIIQDLPGPKIRTGKLENGAIELIENSTIKITSRDITGNNKIISSNYPRLINDVRKNEMILLDDGNLRLRVISETPTNNEIECEIMSGGILKERKGINLPHTKLNLPSLTKKDIFFLKFGLDNDVDFIAMSFVRSAEDIILLKNKIRSKKRVHL